MNPDKPQIDPHLFEKQLIAFRAFVKEKTGGSFVSFASHPYIDQGEDYKYEIHRKARKALAFQGWRETDIGNGKILAATIASIEIPSSNLVSWQGRYGDEARPHHQLHAAQHERAKAYEIEACLFKLYRESSDGESFAELVGILGRKYPLLAYLFFIKDRSKYLPIAPTFFDKAFSYLGAEFKTSHLCSWENYSIYVGLIKNLQELLAEALLTEVTLLDAHSFAWILATQMEVEGKLADTEAYLTLSPTEREAIVKARIGQGVFRQYLVDYWSRCAVTDCTEVTLLRASHIKPWKDSEFNERLNRYNGLLLSPTLDQCFDSGFVSFDDNGQIIISKHLSKGDAEALHLHADMRLRKIEPQHKIFLSYHRENIYRK